MKDGWIALVDELPPADEMVETKIDDINGVRNVQTLRRSCGLFFFPDGSMYVYYTPTHWRALDDTPGRPTDTEEG